MLVIGRGVNDEEGPTTGRDGHGEAIKGVRPLHMCFDSTVRCGTCDRAPTSHGALSCVALVFARGEDSLRKFSRLGGLLEALEVLVFLLMMAIGRRHDQKCFCS